MKLGSSSLDAGDRRGGKWGASDNHFSSNAFCGFALIKREKPKGRDVTARLMGDPAPGRSALDKAHGAPEIPPDERRERWKPEITPLEIDAKGKKKRRRRGATHCGVKL